MDFVRRALREKADLEPFKQRPTIRIIIGILLITISYIICWPVIILMGILAIYFKEPLLVVIGGPAIYIFSHIVFWVGMLLAGAKYSMIFLRWVTRKFFEKFLSEKELAKILSIDG